MKKITKAFQVFIALMMTTLIANYAVAQCEGFANFPGGENAGKIQHSKYRDYMKSISAASKDKAMSKEDKEAKYSELYPKAFELWKDLYANSPGGSEYHFVDGEKIYSYMASKAEGEEKAGYYKKAYEVLDGRVACFGEKKLRSGALNKSNIYYSKARLAYYKAKDYDVAWDALNNHLEAAGNSTKAGTFSMISYLVIRKFTKEEMSQEDARGWYNKLNEIADYNIANSTSEKTKKNYAAAKTKVEKNYEKYKYKIFDCDYFTNELKPQYEEYFSGKTEYSRADLEFASNDIKRYLKRAGCDETSPFVAEIDAKIEEIKKIIQVTERTNEQWGYLKEKEGALDEAIGFFEKAISEDGLSETKNAKLSLRIAKLKMKQGSPSSAVSYANKALGFNPNYGDAYITIGDAYMKGSRQCGGSFEQRAVAWVAVDMYAKAKSVDAGVADKANDRISRYSGSFPTTEEVFQRPGVSKGGSYRVGCWINRSTTVRTSD